MEEVETTVEFLKEGRRVCLLHCNSTYPTARRCELRFMDRLRNSASRSATRSRAWHCCSTVHSVMGASIIERHITLTGRWKDQTTLPV
jgi:sialic acid synthase SpsE